MNEYKAKLRNIISTHFTITDTSQQGLREADHLVQDVADSFGSCTNCWGAGYDADGQLCNCSRGKRLRILLTGDGLLNA